MPLNITDADRENEWTIARAVLRREQVRHKWLLRAQRPSSETSRVDFRMDLLQPSQWDPLFFFEVKARLKKYDPLKISKEKIGDGFAIARRAGLPLWLWIWFSTEDFARGVLIEHLDRPFSRMCHSCRPGKGEDCFEFPLSQFLERAPISGTYRISPNSHR